LRRHWWNPYRRATQWFAVDAGVAQYSSVTVRVPHRMNSRMKRAPSARSVEAGRSCGATAWGNKSSVGGRSMVAASRVLGA
jgi:hypothetical protein